MDGTDNASHPAPEPPLVSPDGRFYWDGTTWQPFAPSVSPPAPVSRNTITPSVARASYLSRVSTRSLGIGASVIILAVVALMAVSLASGLTKRPARLAASSTSAGSQATTQAAAGSAPQDSSPTEQAPPSAPETHALTGGVTVYAPYSGPNSKTGCEVSDVSREYPTGISGISYPEPPPPRFNDVKAGTQVTVRDADGKVVGVATLDAPTVVDEWQEPSPGYPNSGPDMPSEPSMSPQGFCHYTFSVDSVPSSSFYTVQIGSEPAITESSSQLDQDSWTIAATLGDEHAANEETDVWYMNLCIEAAGLGGSCGNLQATNPAADGTGQGGTGTTPT